MAKQVNSLFRDFEQGPIRPPSEAISLLIRVTRNCPWNRCSFCSVYKGTKFSTRSVSSVKSDIDAIRKHLDNLNCLSNNSDSITKDDLIGIQTLLSIDEKKSFAVALNWYICGSKSVFLQDANSIIIKPHELIDILKYTKTAFPWVERITSYGRSHSIVRINHDNLFDMRLAGLNRLHVGLESGSDKVLKMVRKGCDKKTHIKAGLAVKKAGIELSEYVLLGLGGKNNSVEHALETANAINQINPDFIRLRTLVVPKSSKIFDAYESGKFKTCSGLEIAKELRLFLGKLEGITSRIVSDHMFNLFEELNGKLPEDKEFMINVIDRFIEFSRQDQLLYQVGRRMGIFHCLSDIENSEKFEKVYEFCQNNNINSDNADLVISTAMRSFI